jgi:archaellum biogenesis ATPase FlaH
VFDAKIVAACIADRKSYDKVKAHINAAEFTPTGKFWWGLVETWYAKDPTATGIDASLLRSRAEREAGRNAGMALDWFDALQREACPSPDNVVWEVLELKRTIKWRELAAAMETEWDRPRIMQLADEHAALMKATSLTTTSSVVWGSKLEDLDVALSAGKRIRLWPEALNAKCDGGAMPGDHIVVFGRPEAGKTLFAVNMVAGWLRDKRKVLYVGNEDNIDKIQNRVRSNLSGATKEQMAANPAETVRRCKARGWDNFLALHMHPGSASEIAEIVEEHKPDCLVIDQLRNLHSPGSRGGTKAQRLDDIAIDVRQLLSRYGLVGLSIGQANAGEHGRHKMWLDLDDYDESRTGVPGQADLMIGVGWTPELDAHNQRALSVPKNKLSGDHAGFVVNIDKHRSKIQ